MNVVRARIVRIGNFQGIRIPKPLLQQAGLRGDVKLHAENGRLLVISDDKPRAGWAEAFAQAATHGTCDDLERVNSLPNNFDVTGWTW
jgi:antitoxin MazE